MGQFVFRWSIAFELVHVSRNNRKELTPYNLSHRWWPSIIILRSVGIETFLPADNYRNVGSTNCAQGICFLHDSDSSLSESTQKVSVALCFFHAVVRFREAPVGLYIE